MSKYYIKTIKPYDLKYDDALEMGEILVDAWENSDLKLLIGGPANSYNTDHIQDISDPNERFKAFTRSAKLREYLIHSRAQLMRSWIIESGYIVFGCFKRNEDKKRDRIAGLLMLQVPEPLASKVDKDMGRDGGIMWRLHKSYVQWSIFFQRIWSLEAWYWPGILRRLIEHVMFVHNSVDEIVSTEEEIAQLPDDEVPNVYYPRNKMVYVGAVGVHPHFQRQGLGRMMMQAAFDTVDNLPTKFECNGKTAIGPQKWYLEASKAGKKLYLQLGYESITDFIRPDNSSVVSTFMIKTR